MKEVDVTIHETSHSSLGLLTELFSNMDKGTLSSILSKHNNDVLATIEECLDYTESRDNISYPTTPVLGDPDSDASRDMVTNETLSPPAPAPTFVKDTTIPRTGSPTAAVTVKTEVEAMAVCESPSPVPLAPSPTTAATTAVSATTVFSSATTPPATHEFSISNLMTKNPAGPRPPPTSTVAATAGDTPPTSRAGSNSPIMRLMWPFSDAALLRTLVTCNSCNSIIQLGDKFCRVCGMPALPFLL